MATLEQFVFYKNFAYRAFDYLHKKINRYIIPTLEVDLADMVDFTFANIRRPNMVFLHIDNILAECKNHNNINKVYSMIIIVLTHELHHIEQVISQETYYLDKIYRISIENSVNFKSYNFLCANKYEIDRIFEMNLDLTYLEDLNGRKGYKKWDRFYETCTVEQMYKYTIMNTIFRKDIKYYQFEEECLNKYDNIVIAFEYGPNFLIKSNGEFCGQILNEFVSAVGAVAGIYDRYTVKISKSEKPYRDKESVIYITFTLSNGQIYPMIFSKN